MRCLTALMLSDVCIPAQVSLVRPQDPAPTLSLPPPRPPSRKCSLYFHPSSPPLSLRLARRSGPLWCLPLLWLRLQGLDLAPSAPTPQTPRFVPSLTENGACTLL